MSERDLNRLGADGKPPLAAHSQQQLPNSKSTPALHHVSNNNISEYPARVISNRTDSIQ